MEDIKFAVVGCGNIGKRHIAVIDAQDRAELVAICDINEKVCQELSSQYSNVPYFINYEEMIKSTDADIISIATPHGLHAEMTITSARAGKNILVEKPMALTVSDCQRMNNEAKINNVKLMVVKQNRYNIPIALTKKALELKALGRIFMIKCDVLWNRKKEYYLESDWRGIKKQEGGVLYTQVSHFIDLMILFCGKPISAKTSISNKNHEIEIEDCGVSVMEFDTGVTGILNWTNCVYNKNYEGSLTIIGENGTIKIGGAYLNKIEFWDVKSYPLPENVSFIDKPNAYGKYQGTSSNHEKVVNEVVASLLQERSDIVEGDEGMKTIEAIELIYANAL
jgi:UDP-N-acetyl-2-amino-2-deoxyglucuronate dehydrogenase